MRAKFLSLLNQRKLLPEEADFCAILLERYSSPAILTVKSMEIREDISCELLFLLALPASQKRAPLEPVKRAQRALEIPKPVKAVKISVCVVVAAFAMQVTQAP